MIFLLLAILALPFADESGPASTQLHPKRLFAIEGLQAPESAVHDPEQDVYFISNINGEGTAKDDNGFISKVNVDGKIKTLKFIEGGRNGVTLNAPKGLTISGNLLWVADIDTVRAFDRKTGKLVRNVDLTRLGAIFLNDITTDKNGDVYITDTSLRFDEKGNATHVGPNRVFRIQKDASASVAVEGPSLEGPDGIQWDNNRFLIVALRGKDILSWTPGKKPEVFTTGIGGFDGIVKLSDGRFLVSSLDSSSVFLFENRKATEIIKGIENPADIALDKKRHRLLIPSFSLNRVEVWQL
jgi:sugar lactone lactonase YvrE